MKISHFRVFCNRNKGSDIGSVVANSTELIRFYNPRIDVWNEHFSLDGLVITPLTKIGEATVRIFQMNHEDQLMERETLSRVGRYPGEAALLLITEH